MLQTENSHPALKARYRRTNKRNVDKQLGERERIQSNTREILQRFETPASAKAVGIDEESMPSVNLDDHHTIGKSERSCVILNDWAADLGANGMSGVSVAYLVVVSLLSVCLEHRGPTYGPHPRPIQGPRV